MVYAQLTRETDRKWEGGRGRRKRERGGWGVRRSD